MWGVDLLIGKNKGILSGFCDVFKFVCQEFRGVFLQ